MSTAAAAAASATCTTWAPLASTAPSTLDNPARSAAADFDVAAAPDLYLTMTLSCAPAVAGTASNAIDVRASPKWPVT